MHGNWETITLILGLSGMDQHPISGEEQIKIFHQLFYDYFRNWNTVFPCISAHALGHNVKQVPPPPHPSNKHPTPSSLTLNSRVTRKTCFYCHFVYDFLRFTQNKISTGKYQALPLIELPSLLPIGSHPYGCNILNQCWGPYLRKYGKP